MSDISEFERRISAALDQIARDVDVLVARPSGVGATEAEPDNGPDTAALEQALGDEKMANQQLEERLKALRLKLDKKDAEAELAQVDLKSALAEMDGALRALRESCDQLRASNTELREAHEAGISDGTAVNKGLAAELAALKADRQAEAAEAAAIAAALDPLITRAEAPAEELAAQSADEVADPVEGQTADADQIVAAQEEADAEATGQVVAGQEEEATDA
ncbi:hypothetical protein [Thalassobius sp. Cn5-15]|uniref:hypothetical protein n=1 Tax=Thalassobius sp. Cn5-15 TaxID=2917763 RepID=UPI001EF28867|nr:hypothetical protein [Thalassobius sp. Cn5-15]MCG7492348.1 hypothetical protein [Thalassobius sp. Cn5-15]